MEAEIKKEIQQAKLKLFNFNKQNAKYKIGERVNIPSSYTKLGILGRNLTFIPSLEVTICHIDYSDEGNIIEIFGKKDNGDIYYLTKKLT